ncbi:MAG: oxidoreductase [Gemmatimonadota bacterium]
MRIPIFVLLALGVVVVRGRRLPVEPQVRVKAPITWVLQHGDSSTAFRGLAAPNDTVVWASGSGGVVARSVDGGRSWTTHRIAGADSLFLVDVAAFDARAAVVVGTSFEGGLAKVFRTDDGGASWRTQYTDERNGAFYDGLACWDRQRCVAFGDAMGGRLVIVRTDDGAHWRRVKGDGVPAALPGEAGFAASGTSITAAGRRHAWIGTGGGDRARVYRTSDGGRTWQVSDTPLPAGQSAGIFGIAFQDTLHGMAVGGDYTKPEDPAPNVLLTDDGGRTWRMAGRTEPAGVKWGLATVPGMPGAYVAVSPAGTGFTTDDGATWTGIGGGGYNTVVFAAPDAGWVAGNEGRIARASNALQP